MNESNYNDVLGWDDAIENDGEEFITLPEGDYEFEVTNLERGNFPGSEKLCPCPKATLSLRISTDKGETTVFDDLILHKKLEWKLSGFLRAIGLRKKGEKSPVAWNRVVGCKGRAHIYVNKYTGKDGAPRENNKVSKYYDFDESKMKDNDFVSIPDGAGDAIPFN